MAAAAYISSPLTANGSGVGVLTIADTTLLVAGAKGVVVALGVEPMHVKIASIGGPTTLTAVHPDTETVLDLSAYTTAKGARFTQYEQRDVNAFIPGTYVLRSGDTMTGALTVGALIWSTVGGFKFPDGSIQSTASSVSAGNTVVSETSFGLSATAGVSASFSRADHSHGTPAAPTPGSIGAAEAVHTHAHTDITPVASDRLLGRDSAAPGAVEELTVGGGIEFTGSGGIQRSALTGDVTASAGGTVTAISNNAVTYAKLQDVSTHDRVLGRVTAGAGDVEEIVCTAFARTILDDVDAAAVRATIGVGAGTGDVVGPGSATDRAIATFSGTTGKLIQNSGVIIDASNNVTGVATLGVGGAPFAGTVRINAANSAGVGGDLWLSNSGTNAVGSATRIAFSSDADTDATPTGSIENVITNSGTSAADLVFKTFGGGGSHGGYLERARIKNDGTLEVHSNALNAKVVFNPGLYTMYGHYNPNPNGGHFELKGGPDGGGTIILGGNGRGDGNINDIIFATGTGTFNGGGLTVTGRFDAASAFYLYLPETISYSSTTDGGYHLAIDNPAAGSAGIKFTRSGATTNCWQAFVAKTVNAFKIGRDNLADHFVIDSSGTTTIDTNAAATTAALVLKNTVGDKQYFIGSGSPNSAITGSVGDEYEDLASGTTYKKTSGSPSNTGWVALGTGSGDVVGPSSSVNNAFALFDGTTGKLLECAVNLTVSAAGEITHRRDVNAESISFFADNRDTGTSAKTIGIKSFNDSGNWVQIGITSSTFSGANYLADESFVTATAGLMINAGGLTRVKNGMAVNVSGDSTNGNFTVDTNTVASAFVVNAGADTASFAVPLALTTATANNGVTLGGATYQIDVLKTSGHAQLKVETSDAGQNASITVVNDNNATAGLYTDGNDARLGLSPGTGGVSRIDADDVLAINNSTVDGLRITQDDKTTVSSGSTDMAILTTESGKNYYIEIHLIGRQTGGTAGAAGDAFAYTLRGVVKNVGGTVTVLDTEGDLVYEAAAVTIGSLQVSGANVTLDVTGATDRDISWHTTSFVSLI